MRFIGALISGAFLLVIGCNSKPSRPEATEEPVASTPTPDQAKTVFRNRSASLQATSNGVHVAKSPVMAAKKRPPFPSTAAGVSRTAQEESATTETTEAAADAVAENVRPEDIPEEGDEILVPPSMLGKLFPGANFDAVQRQEPINIKSVLDQQGIILTNYQQLVELGITNYQIVRVQRPVETNGEK